MGFVPIAKGEITILGNSVSQALKSRLIAYVPQSEEVDWSFPVLVEDVVMMGRYGHMGQLRIASATDHIAVDEALNRVGMSSFGIDRLVSYPAVSASVSLLPVHSLNRVKSSFWMSRLPGSMYKPKMPSSPCCAHFVMRVG